LQPNLIITNESWLNKNALPVEKMFDFAVEVAFDKVKIIGCEID
jgi:hypothetical protein